MGTKRKRSRKLSHHLRVVGKSVGYPFDWSYILQLEAAKIKSMIPFFERFDKECRKNDSGRPHRDIETMGMYLKLIDIAINPYKYDKNHKSVNIRNASRFFSESDLKQWEGKSIFKTTLYEEKAWRLLHEYRATYMRGWWY